ncbi:hypothetical protein MLD38_021250 [Melastoma candidum]|uniref:Uncharacterized protein n=1 Tax=Melastoma candidum TaxID=119954 RepID=A0ACB9QFP9_9MYRT|nr:hypothetical protein MLD38_021250 [Melastoma candidum]
MELTLDGQSAISICRRLTRPKDYYATGEQGQEVNKDKLCINVLEREMQRDPFSVDDSVAAPITLRLRNCSFRLAHAERTYEFAGLSKRKGSSRNLRDVDLNETPITQNKQLRSRMEALQRTVEMGMWYFPNCSEVLDKFMEDDLLDLCFLNKGMTDKQSIMTSRYVELKEDVQKAFSKDKAELNQSGLQTDHGGSRKSSKKAYMCTSLQHS